MLERACWVWLGFTNTKGYGMISRLCKDGLVHKAMMHKLVWEEVNGKIPKGKELHHRCENKLCYNPEHIRAVTSKEHKAIHRSILCKKGLHLSTKGRCKECQKNYTREWKCGRRRKV